MPLALVAEDLVLFALQPSTVHCMLIRSLVERVKEVSPQAVPSAPSLPVPSCRPACWAVAEAGQENLSVPVAAGQVGHDLTQEISDSHIYQGVLFVGICDEKVVIPAPGGGGGPGTLPGARDTVAFGADGDGAGGGPGGRIPVWGGGGPGGGPLPGGGPIRDTQCYTCYSEVTTKVGPTWWARHESLPMKRIL